LNPNQSFHNEREELKFIGMPRLYTASYLSFIHIKEKQ